MSDLLILEKQNNFINGLEMIEYLPKQRIQALIVSGLLLVDWDEKFSTSLDNNKVREQYTNEVQQLKAYLKAYNPALGGVKIKYSRGRSHFGRGYCVFNYGLTPFRKVTRNSLILDLYYDFDLKSAHPSITKYICKIARIPTPETTKYITNRDAIHQEICDEFNVNIDEAKDLFIRLGFGGSFEKWAKDNKIITPVATDFIVAYKREVREIAERLKELNPILWANVKNNNKKGDDECLRSFFAKYLQELETRIVGNVLSHIVNTTELTKHPTNPNTIVPVGSYEYDGFKLLKENVDKFGGVDAVLDLIHARTANYGFPDLIWVCKPFKEYNDLTEWVEMVEDTDKEDPEFKIVCEKIQRIRIRQDAGIVEFINEILPNHFIYSLEKGDKSSQGNWFCWDEQRWRSNDLPLKNTITYKVEDYLNKLLEDYTDYLYKPAETDCPTANQKLYVNAVENLEIIISSITTSVGVNNIVNQAKQTFANYTLEFDNKPFLLGFENGVMNLELMEFRPYNFEDKVSFSCGYDFIPYNPIIKVFENDDKPFVRNKKVEQDEIASNRVESFFKEIQPDESIRKCVLILLSTGLIGIAIELFTIFNGGGRNGKGVLNTLMKDATGDYSVKMSASVLTELKRNSGASNPEIAKLNKMRFVYWNEPAKGVPLQNSICKELTGGGTIQARGNYSNKTTVKLHNTTFGECNSKPNWAEKPENADIERVIDILFGSLFSNDEEEIDNVSVFKSDNDLKPLFEKEEYKVALINILITNLKEVMDAKLNVKAFIPESVKIRSLEYLNKSNDINNLFLEVFEKRRDGVEYFDKEGKPFDEDWSLPSIAKVIRSSRTTFYTLSKKTQQELTKENIKGFFLTNKIYKKMVVKDTHSKQMFLKGYRLKEPEDEDDDE